jgi:hypothetical protein
MLSLSTYAQSAKQQLEALGYVTIGEVYEDRTTANDDGNDNQ